MKKLMNNADAYVDDMLRGIYRQNKGVVTYADDDLRCYITARKKDGKVAIVTGGGTGHLPLFLGYVGNGLLDGCGVGGVFQSPSADQVYRICKAVDSGAGVLFIYGNYTGDIMTFDMASELCEMDGITCRQVIGNDDVLSADKGDEKNRRGVAGIYFLYKCAGAKAEGMSTLDEVAEAAELARRNTRTVGFAFSPSIIPEKGVPNFTLADDEMAMGMGIHGEPGIWNGPMRTSREIASEAVDAILADMPMKAGEKVEILVNGLGATSLEELYIFLDDVYDLLEGKGIAIHRSHVGEYATSMEMAGASLSICRIENEEMQNLLDSPVDTPFIHFR